MRGRRTGEEAQHSKQHAQRLVDLQHLWLGYRPSKRFAIQCVQHVLAQLKDEQRRASQAEAKRNTAYSVQQRQLVAGRGSRRRRRRRRRKEQPMLCHTLGFTRRSRITAIVKCHQGAPARREVG